MVDFELSFINAAGQYEAGRGVTCCFFHYVSNIKKKARPVIDALKKGGVNTPEVRLAQKTKSAVMMLPLHPIDLITVEVVVLIFGDGLNHFLGVLQTLTSSSAISSKTTSVPMRVSQSNCGV